MSSPEPHPTPAPAPLPIEVDLGRARAAIIEAELAERPADRYLAAHLAALRVAAVVLALRAHPTLSGRQQRPRNAWRVLAEVAPEFGEWAAFFHATESRRELIRAGGSVSAREADDLARDAQAFLGLVERVVAPLLSRERRRR